MRKKRIVTELTALLDVMLIMFFWALLNASNRVDTAEAAALEAQRMQQQAEDAYEEAKRIQNSYSTLDAMSYVISITVEKQDSNRVLYISCDGEAQVEFTYNWDNTEQAKTELTDYLTRQTDSVSQSEQKITYIVFQYEPLVIYNADFILIDNVVSDFVKSHNDIYYATREIEYNK